MLFHQEDITIVNIYAPNIGTSKYIKQILIELLGEIDNKAIIVGNFNIPFSTEDKSSGHNIKKEILNLTYF